MTWHLSAMFRSAVRKGYASKNPVETLGPDERPKPQSREAAYFADDELPRLVAALDDFDKPLFRLALLTGMRQDEILSLLWRDVHLDHAEIRVADAKSDEGRRRVDLVPEAVALLKAVREDIGAIPHPATLVFAGSRGKRSASYTTKTLYKAMAAATDPDELDDDGEPKAKPIPREGPTGELRTFRSLRHTFARLALENGAELTWLRRQMGHSSVAFTDKRYGHWARAARKKQAEALGATGAFSF